jgi:hypothetical protein
MQVELFAGELSIDYFSCTGQFSVQAAIRYSSWVSFDFDGEKFELGGRI